MIEFVKPEKFEWEKLTSTYGRCVIEPLEKGYGVTVGNALRRVLLSSIEGAAPTAVKFEGAYHEFTTLPGVREDLTEIILNIKSLRFALYGESPINISLKKRGPGKVYAKDFEIPSQLKLLTPDVEIATLDNENAVLDMEIRIDKGKGFVLSEDIQELFNITTLGWIALDADFSPVKKVAFRSENTRKGKRTDYDKLILEIWTDGSLSPAEALGKACQILVEHFNMVSSNLAGAKVEEEKKLSENVLKKPVSELNVPQRVINFLQEAGIKTVGDVIEYGPVKLLEIKGLGKKSIAKISEALKELGVSLEVSEDEA